MPAPTVRSAGFAGAPSASPSGNERKVVNALGLVVPRCASRRRPLRLLPRTARTRRTHVARSARRGPSPALDTDPARTADRRRLLRDGRRADRLDPLGRLSLPVAQPAALRPAGAWTRVPRRASVLGRPVTAHARTRRYGAALAAATWGLLGLTVPPRRDVAGALAVLPPLAFLWRSRNRAFYASVFPIVAALEFPCGPRSEPGVGHLAAGPPTPDGNPPSGVASGFHKFRST